VKGLSTRNVSGSKMGVHEAPAREAGTHAWGKRTGGWLSLSASSSPSSSAPASGLAKSGLVGMGSVCSLLPSSLYWSDGWREATVGVGAAALVLLLVSRRST
jgi:hypothetical protein